MNKLITALNYLIYLLLSSSDMIPILPTTKIIPLTQKVSWEVSALSIRVCKLLGNVEGNKRLA